MKLYEWKHLSFCGHTQEPSMIGEAQNNTPTKLFPASPYTPAREKIDSKKVCRHVSTKRIKSPSLLGTYTQARKRDAFKKIIEDNLFNAL